MEFETPYALKLFFPNTSFIQIYFEAVHNAFDAGADEIDIKISTDGKIKPNHLQIKISDNGGGFTNERYERFKKVKEPQDPYHKGLGRLVYLNYFNEIEIISTYNDKKREFTFSDEFDGSSELSDFKFNQSGTKLHFKNFRGDRLKSYDDIKPTYIKDQLRQQFLPYLHKRKIDSKSFKINIELSTRESHPDKDFYSDKIQLTESDIPKLEKKSISDDSIDVFSDITMWYMVGDKLGISSQLTAACIDDRTIKLDLLNSNSLPLNYSVIFLFESELFAGKSDSARQRLVLPDSIPQRNLFRLLRKEISIVLNKEIPEIDKRNRETTKLFEERFPHLAGFFEEQTVGIIDKDEALEIAQSRFFKQQKEVLESTSLDNETFQKSLEVSSRTLTEYILYRELIIKKMREFGEEDSEADIHNLIVPRYETFQEQTLVENKYKTNAWLLDDKFMSFRTVLSEPKMKDLIAAITLNEESSDDQGRPDISFIFSADPNEQEKVDVVVVEIKKKVVDDKENPYAATQLVKRAQKLVDHCPNIQRVWYFALIEIDENLSQLLTNMKWTPLFSKGKVFYQDFQVKNKENEIVPTPTCLLSYDAVIEDAAARNHTFLEILKKDIKDFNSSSNN